MGATLRCVERPLRRRSNASVSLAGRWSRVAGRLGRGSMVAGRGPWVAGCGSRFAVPSIGRQTLVARNVCYADVWAVWHIFHVASGIRTTTVSDVWPHVDRHGLSKIGRSPVRVNWKTTHSVARSLAHVQGASVRASDAIFSCERGATSCVRM